MNSKIQIELFDQYTAHLRSLMQSKGDDYSGPGIVDTTDRLANFKIAASLTNHTPSQQALSLIATKVARLSALLANPGRTPNNESVKDSCLDGGLYFFLLAMLEHEAAQEREVECEALESEFIEKHDGEGRLVRVRLKY